MTMCQLMSPVTSSSVTSCEERNQQPKPDPRGQPCVAGWPARARQHRIATSGAPDGGADNVGDRPVHGQRTD